MDQCRSLEANGHSLEARPLVVPLSTAKRFIFMMFCHCLKLSTRKPLLVSKLLARARFLLRHYFARELQSARFRFVDLRYVPSQINISHFSKPLLTKQ